MYVCSKYRESRQCMYRQLYVRMYRFTAVCVCILGEGMYILFEVNN